MSSFVIFFTNVFYSGNTTSLFGVVINFVWYFHLASLNAFFYKDRGCYIFPLHSASWSCALGSGEGGRER